MWAADKQKRIRPAIIGVAGKPTPTAAIFRVESSRTTALKNVDFFQKFIPTWKTVQKTYAILENKYTIIGTTGEFSCPIIMTPICSNLRRKYTVFRAN